MTEPSFCLPRRRATGAGDRGAALVTVLLLLMALTAIATTVATVALNDTASANRDRQSAGALATADAGIAYGMEYIRNNGLDSLTCLAGRPITTPDSCAGNPSISNPTSPRKVNVSASGACTTGSTCYDVWISAVSRYNPPAVKEGVYRVHSLGRFGGSPAAKALAVDVRVRPASYPIGVYGTYLVGNGGTQVVNELLFTQDCVTPRYNGSGNGLRFEGVDAYWGEPASANSTTQVSTANSCGSSGYVHKDGPCPSSAALQFDRSSMGDAIPESSPCSFTYTRPDGTVGKRTSTKFSLEIMAAEYQFQPGGLSDSQYKALKARAQSLNTYNAPTGALHDRLAAAVTAGVNQPVVYYDNLSQVDLSSSNIPNIFGRDPATGVCSPLSVVIVVRNGNLTYQGGNSVWRSLALFVPEGNFTGNGGYNILGTLFTRELSITGGQKFELDECFIKNLPGPVMTLKIISFREDDRSDVS